MLENLDLNALLLWLSGIGSVLAVSWCVERWNWFQSLSSEMKRVATWASAGLISTGALWVIKNVDPLTLAAIADYAKAWISVFIYVFLQEQFHAKTKAQSVGMTVTIDEDRLVKAIKDELSEK